MNKYCPYTMLILLGACLQPALGQNTDPSAGVFKDKGGDRITVQSGGTMRTLTGCAVTTTDGVGTVASTNGVTLVETGIGPVHLTTFTFTSAFDLKVIDSGANGGHAGVKIYDFPSGYVQILGAEINADFYANTNGLTATSTHDIGIGTTDVATDNNALATTEQDIIAKIEGNTSDNGTNTTAELHGVLTTVTPFDGTTTAKDLFFNAAFEADDCSADTLAYVTGTFKIFWINLGDY